MFGLAACGGGDGGGGEAAPQGENVVLIDTFMFKPKSPTVKAGTTVTWMNNDTVQHVVESGTPDDPTGVFDKPIDPNGATATVTFDKPGAIAYFCSIHKSMRGEVIVQG
ncbi:MAG: cupredoxin domain-containing protein [Egibacteraceae bacterium]